MTEIRDGDEESLPQGRGQFPSAVLVMTQALAPRARGIFSENVKKFHFLRLFQQSLK